MNQKKILECHITETICYLSPEQFRGQKKEFRFFKLKKHLPTERGCEDRKKDR